MTGGFFRILLGACADDIAFINLVNFIRHSAVIHFVVKIFGGGDRCLRSVIGILSAGAGGKQGQTKTHGIDMTLFFVFIWMTSFFIFKYRKSYFIFPIT